MTHTLSLNKKPSTSFKRAARACAARIILPAVIAASGFFLAVMPSSSPVAFESTHVQKAPQEITAFRLTDNLKWCPDFPEFVPKILKNPSLFIEGEKIDLRYWTDKRFEENQVYYKTRRDIDAFLSKNHDDPFLQRRVDAVNEVIKIASRIDSPVWRIEAVNGFVNMLLPYDLIKRTTGTMDDSKRPAYYRFDSFGNAFQETLKGGIDGGVVCLDHSTFKTEMLVRTGFAPENVSVFYLSTQDQDLHTVTGVKTNKETLLLDSIRIDDAVAEKASLSTLFGFAAMAFSPSEYTETMKEGYIPLSAVNALGEIVFYTFEKGVFSKESERAPPSEKDRALIIDIREIACLMYMERGGACLENPPKRHRDAPKEMLAKNPAP